MEKFPKVTIRVKCVSCGKIRIVGEEQTTMPLCNHCGSPMIVYTGAVDFGEVDKDDK